MRLVVSLLSVSAFCLLLTSPAQSEEWGTLKGRIVYDGPAPKPEAVNVTKDQAFCGKHNLVDEDLVVNPENKGLANVAIWLYVGRRDPNPPVHESYAKTADDKVTLTNDKCRFEPHVALLRTSQTLVLGNDDPVGHNTKIDTFVNQPINYTIPSESKLEQTFSEKERLPAAVSCSIHPWMKAWLVVQDHPYMAVTDKDGNFEITNVPAGEWTFQFWQEKAGYLSGISAGGNEADRRGQVELTVKPGENDLGEIKVSPDLFK